MNASAGRAVLVGVDGSSAARRAAVWAAAFASRTEAPLRRVHVLPEALYLMTDAAVMGQGPAIAQHRAAGQRFLDDASTEARLGFPGVDVHTELVPGPTAPALAAAGATSGMIVLGAGTPSGVGALAAGSTAIALARHARCPITLCRRQSEMLPDRRPVVVGIGDGDSSAAAVLSAFDFAHLFGAP